MHKLKDFVIGEAKELVETNSNEEEDENHFS